MFYLLMYPQYQIYYLVLNIYKSFIALVDNTQQTHFTKSAQSFMSTLNIFKNCFHYMTEIQRNIKVYKAFLQSKFFLKKSLWTVQ